MKSGKNSIGVKGFETLFEEHFDDVAAFLYAYASNEAELKDWIQEVFIKLWEKRHKIDFHHPSFKGYLLKTARNHALKNLQGQKRYSAWLEENLVHLTDLLKNEPLEKEDFPDGLESAYDRALSRLPARTRETWKLSREEGLSYPEIAQVMGVSVKTVEVQIGNALRILRKELHEFQK